MTDPVVVAVDGGGSKTVAAVVSVQTGLTVASVRGAGCSAHHLGLDTAVGAIDDLVREALGKAGVHDHEVVHAGCYLTAMDLPVEIETMHAALSALPWAARSLTVDNDVFAVLRAGTDSTDAAVVVCGTGINGAAVSADGRTARILSFGDISGDWGGGSGLAEQVLWHAARDEDGRGPRTALRAALLQWTGFDSVRALSIALHEQRASTQQWWSRVPDLFEIARSGDSVATELVRRQGEEIGLLAASLLHRLGLSDRTVPVVLGGSIATSGEPILERALLTALGAGAPGASVVTLSQEPIAGAVALSLAHVHA